jgi:hypothetical protein
MSDQLAVATMRGPRDHARLGSSHVERLLRWVLAVTAFLHHLQ